MDVSYVLLCMSPNNDLLVYRNKGRRNAKDAEVFKCPNSIKAELKKLKESLNYKENTEILLAISIATDDMVRHVQMFPEVMYLDTTAGTNKQHRNLFLMVVKDASGGTFIGNATVIPSEKAWVFHYIYQKFFIMLYGEETLNRARLFLTDDDDAMHGTLDNCIETLKHYSKARHMLCVFHAIVMAFKEKVNPKLPHKSKHELTEEGEMYGKTFVFMVTLVIINFLVHTRFWSTPEMS